MYKYLKDGSIICVEQPGNICSAVCKYFEADSSMEFINYVTCTKFKHTICDGNDFRFRLPECLKNEDTTVKTVPVRKTDVYNPYMIIESDMDKPELCSTNCSYHRNVENKFTVCSKYDKQIMCDERCKECLDEN